MGFAYKHVALLESQHGLLFEEKDASPEWGHDPLSCKADTSARKLPGLWDRVPVLGASNYVDKLTHFRSNLHEHEVVLQLR